jgi:DNA polymerase I-like protein with 3'-5' exonuclease and polymerase domains
MQILAHQINNPSPQLYNAYDCLMPHEILERIPDGGIIYQFERALQAPVMEMMLRGIKVDLLKAEAAIKKLKADLAYLDKILETLVSSVWDRPYTPTFPNSTKQLIEFFYDCLAIPRINVSVKGQVKTPMDRKILERLHLHFHARPIVSAILAHRDITGQLEVLETQVDSDSRIRSSINIASTTTGRFSSSRSTTGSGGNIQNITGDLRYIFIADEGHKVGAVDKEQAESREVGYWCGVVLGDWSYLDAVESGDIHTYTTRLIWPDLPWTGDLAKDRIIAEQPFYRHFTYREITKRAGHGTNYQGKPYTIAGELHVPIKLIQEFQPKYFSAFPCIYNMHQWVAQEIQTKGYLINVFGRRRDFFDRTNADETIRSAVAFLFQSATADDINLGIWRLWKYLPHRIQLLLQLHDAVYFLYDEKENEQDLFREVLKHLKVELTAPNGRKFSVPCEVKSGKNFGNKYKRDANGKKYVVNENGLDEVKLVA